MKIKKGISLPHPVIGLDDDVAGLFNIDLKLKIINQQLILQENSVQIVNDYFKQLFDSNIITTAYKIKCSSTLYSKTIVGSLNINIPCNELSHTVEIESYLIANEDITNYYDSSFNPDCTLGENRGVFNVKKDAIVGDAGSLKIELDTIFTRGLPGIIEFKPVNIDYPISFDIEGPKIVVSYPKKDGDPDMITVLSQKNSKFKQTFLNLFLIPALTSGFIALINAEIENNYEKFIEDYQWASVIDSLSDDFDKDDDPFVLAQLFLKKLIQDKTRIAEAIPIVGAFNELKN